MAKYLFQNLFDLDSDDILEICIRLFCFAIVKKNLYRLKWPLPAICNSSQRARQSIFRIKLTAVPRNITKYGNKPSSYSLQHANE